MRFTLPLLTALLGVLVAGTAAAQTTTQTLPQVVSANTQLSASQVYLLDGETYVEPGATLTIPAGTIIKGRTTPSTGRGNASVIVVQRGGRIVANGTAAQPVIMTFEDDNVTDAFDFDETVRGRWGGLIILGNATNNRGVRNVEGIDASARTQYGCGDAGFPCDEADDSGVLRYVSVRHAGFTLRPDEEINGVTFGAVGSGTVVEHVEVFANSDDSFEWFGGTVNATYLVGAFSGDDDFDWDTGYTGRIQFAFSIKDDSGDIGRCIEGDGAASPFTSTPLSSPTISNLTCLGTGLGNTPGGGEAGTPTFLLRENTRGFLYNSVAADWQAASGLTLDDQGGNAAISTRQRFIEGSGLLDIRNNIFFDYSVGNTAAAFVTGDDAAVEGLIAARNTFQSPGLIATNGRTQTQMLDPRPAPGALAASGADFTLTGLSDPFFTPVAFRGAFAPGVQVWATGWTALSTGLYFSLNAIPTEAPASSASLGVAVGPNPATTSATVRFSLATAGEARVSLVDVLGREVAVVAEGAFAAGETPATLDVSRLPAGVYVVRLAAADGGVATRTLTVVR